MNTPTEVKRHTVEMVMVELRGGRALCVSLERDAGGEPEQLTLTPGWLSPWRPEHPKTLSLPGGSLSALRAALARLDGGR